ncbi:hypothetical protein CUT44_26975 [Streptomyces carminius]|uniref:Uncharacterized protein n=1 Tax=Streptomyces carminius TaxID=2665496 RepID=A0A2M8LS57_9ACTN|nr:hypothetical protein [Streptomyces carminius]PJE94796.1 hypothetical protein CUT44_26975 [Streptomyces carminius]
MGTADGGTGTGGTYIGSASNSAVSVGDNNTVRNEVVSAPADGGHRELLRAVRELREDLARLVTTPETRALREELDGAEEEIRSTGQAGATRRESLRQRLQDAATAVGALASGAAVGQALAALGG